MKMNFLTLKENYRSRTLYALAIAQENHPTSSFIIQQISKNGPMDGLALKEVARIYDKDQEKLGIESNIEKLSELLVMLIRLTSDI